MKKSLSAIIAGVLGAVTLSVPVLASSNSITAAGSTALQPLVQQAAQMYMQKHSSDTVQVQGGGSGTGLTQVAQGAVDIGNSDIFADEKLDKGTANKLVDHKVCVVGFGVVVNKSVKLKNTGLTQAQLIKIFTGKVTNWKQVGGNNLKITVVNRPKSSGTRATFKKYGLNGAEEAQGVALTQDSSGAVEQTIAQTKGSIGYLALPYLSSKSVKVKVVKINSVAPTVKTITTGKYKIWSYEHMYTNGAPKGLTKSFLDYMNSKEVKAMISKLHYIPLSDMKVKR